MIKQRLGRTAHLSSRIILGCAAFWECEQDEAEETLDLAFENGINHLDIAPQYGNAERVAGPWIGKHRENIFIGCKTMERGYSDAWREFENSLRLLKTETIDLYQFHAVTKNEHVEQIFAPDGAARMFREAQEQGLVRWLGITGHGMFAPTIQLAVLERMDLDTLMFPLTPRLYVDENYRTEAHKLLQIAVERDLGVMTLKAGSKRPWGGRNKTHLPWYEPYDAPEEISADVHFSLSQSPVTAVTSAGDMRLLPHFIRAVQNFKTMDPETQKQLMEKREANSLIFNGSEQIF